MELTKLNEWLATDEHGVIWIRAAANANELKACASRVAEGKKLNWASVSEIRDLNANGGLTQQEIADKFGVTAQTVGQVILNRAWHDPAYRPPVAREVDNRSKLTPEQVDKIKVLLATGVFAQHEIADRFGVSQTAVSHIALGKTWSE